MRWLVLSAVAGALIGVSVFAASAADAEPAQPGPTTTSSSDELTDMVLDVVEHGAVTAPTTTPVPAPPR
jgi:hypothetical protein